MIGKDNARRRAEQQAAMAAIRERNRPENRPMCLEILPDGRLVKDGANIRYHDFELKDEGLGLLEKRLELALERVRHIRSGGEDELRRIVAEKHGLV